MLPTRRLGVLLILRTTLLSAPSATLRALFFAWVPLKREWTSILLLLCVTLLDRLPLLVGLSLVLALEGLRDTVCRRGRCGHV